MFRAEELSVAEAEGARTLPLELAEVSTIAGRTMVTAIGGGLRLTAITARLPGARVGDTVHVGLPEAPSAWFAPSGERIA
jgi:iron(III) transport system ATP-binding protein